MGCFTVALLFLAFIGSILVIVFSAMKSTDVYKEALMRAKADPAVIEALGSPIKDGSSSRETQTSTAHPVNPTWQFQSLVPREKEQFTFQQPSPSGAGFTRGSLSKSAARMNALICSRLRLQ